MKIRTDFVTNSSSSSYAVEICVKNKQNKTVEFCTQTDEDISVFINENDVLELESPDKLNEMISQDIYFQTSDMEQFNIQDVSEYIERTENEEEDEEEKCPECGKPLDECTCEKNEDKKDKYNLNEIPEYIELKNNFDELTSKFEALQKSANEAAEELSVLKEYKAQIERENKQKLIDEFDMLSEEDKEDVVKNIDTYSLDDIEAKLSVICVRNNKINFSKNTETEPTVYSMNGLQDDGAPAWVKAVRETQNNLN